jgi:hypothetical protein
MWGILKMLLKNRDREGVAVYDFCRGGFTVLNLRSPS